MTLKSRTNNLLRPTETSTYGLELEIPNDLDNKTIDNASINFWI
jgi:hypothetical protein